MVFFQSPRSGHRSSPPTLPRTSHRTHFSDSSRPDIALIGAPFGAEMPASPDGAKTGSTADSRPRLLRVPHRSPVTVAVGATGSYSARWAFGPDVLELGRVGFGHSKEGIDGAPPPVNTRVG